MKNLLLIFIILIPLFIVSCDRKVSVSDPYVFESGTAKFFVSSYPEGAEIYVDEKPAGLFTPDTIKWLKDGVHQFKLKLYPFLDYSFSELASSDKVNMFDYDFYSDPKNFGSFYFTSSPDSCSVYVNDSLMDFNTPYILRNLIPGNYKIKYSYPEHRSDSTNAFLYAGKQTNVSLELADTSVWVTYTTENSDMPDNTINDIFIDENNIIWIGTWHNGIVKLNNGPIEFLNTSNSNLPSDIIHCIRKDANNTVWVGTYSGIAKITNNIINTLTTVNSGLPSNYISDIAFDNQMNIWIGTNKGLVKYNGSNWIVYNTSNSGIPGNSISSIYIDNEDNIWLGTIAENTIKFNGIDLWEIFRSDDTEIGDTVADLIMDSENNLWVGTITSYTGPGILEKPGGVFILRNNSLSAVNFELPNKRINKFFIDKNNILWVGSRSGLLSVTTIGNYKLFYNQNSGLPINDVISINRDNNDNMWIGTNGGGLVKYKTWNE